MEQTSLCLFSTKLVQPSKVTVWKKWGPTPKTTHPHKHRVLLNRNRCPRPFRNSSTPTLEAIDNTLHVSDELQFCNPNGMGGTHRLFFGYQGLPKATKRGTTASLGFEGGGGGLFHPLQVPIRAVRVLIPHYLEVELLVG